MKLNPLNDRRTTVYRLFNRDDVLLYVGVSWNPKTRIPNHRDKPWWPQVTKTTIDLHPDRATALRAEAVAIVEESPLYNLAVPDPEGVRAPRQYDLPRNLSGHTWPEAMRSAGIRPQKNGRPPSEVERRTAIRAWLIWKQEAGEA